MDRCDLNVRRTAAVLACVAALGKGSSVRAQALHTLHVRSFTQQVDDARPQIGQLFHLTISTHVDEQIAELENVTLPNLAAFDDEGDERTCRATVRGSDCTEIVALAPKMAGAIVIAAATMDAIDARNKKPSRYATNTVRVQVGGTLAPSPSPSVVPPATFGGDSYLADLLWSTLRLFLIALALAVLVWYVAYRYLRSRRSRPLSAVAPPIAAVAPPREDFARQFVVLVEALRAEPTRSRALAVRQALRHALGAHDKETLADLLQRNAAGERADQIAALRAIERATFCEDARVGHNVAEALPFLTL